MKKLFRLLGWFLLVFGCIGFVSITFSACSILKDLEGPLPVRILYFALFLILLAGIALSGWKLILVAGEAAFRKTEPSDGGIRFVPPTAAKAGVSRTVSPVPGEPARSAQHDPEGPASAGSFSGQSEQEPAAQHSDPVWAPSGRSSARPSAAERTAAPLPVADNTRRSFFRGLLPYEKDYEPAKHDSRIGREDEIRTDGFVLLFKIDDCRVWYNVYYDPVYHRLVADHFSFGFIDDKYLRFHSRQTFFPDDLLSMIRKNHPNLIGTAKSRIDALIRKDPEHENS